jgi:hypothetical protein
MHLVTSAAFLVTAWRVVPPAFPQPYGTDSTGDQRHLAGHRQAVNVTASGGVVSSGESTTWKGRIMRVFVAGATGALGRHLVPALVAAGHEVTGTTRTPGKVAQLRDVGAEPVVVDGLDREAVIAAVRPPGRR